ncbi:MAG: DNA replication/repair protein RecF, partial [Christensenellaceae bacterium]|nr:DNA replication/repair protein RecF [Christensenellaceae bacterium]
NIFTGDNAQGKTNLVEAMGYLASAKSFRGAQDGQLIRQGADCARIATEYRCRSHRGKIEATLLSDERRSIRIDGMPIRKISEMMGVLNCVIFAPEDLKTVKESPSLRRRLMDLEISKIRPSYYLDLQRYAIALKSKNKLLKDFAPDDALLGAYNATLLEAGSKVIARRQKFVDLLSAHAAELHSLLTDGKEQLSLQYRACCELSDIPTAFAAKLEGAKAREREMRVSLVGPHREDLMITIGGRDSKLYASQGQQRTAMLAIKLACARIAYESTGEMPVVLLDDVFSELDISRRERLLSLVAKHQVFITATDEAGIGSFKGARFYRVENGLVFCK